MAPMLLADKPGLHSAHSQAAQILAFHDVSAAETLNAPGMGLPKARRVRIFSLNMNCKNLIVACGPSTTRRKSPLEFKQWQ
jgi:hypothetical protein